MAKVTRRARVTRDQAQIAIDTMVQLLDDPTISSGDKLRTADNVLKHYYSALTKFNKKPHEGIARLPKILEITAQYANIDSTPITTDINNDAVAYDERHHESSGEGGSDTTQSQGVGG